MSNYISAKIKSVKKENYRINTIALEKSIHAEPGQFLMVWIPGVDEKPFGIANDDPLTLTIANVGPFSSKICSLKEGELFSFKGPFGKSFSLTKEKEILIVAGGYGVVPLYFLAERAKEKGIKVTVILGAKSAQDIIYEENFKKLGCELLICTDDGSKGTKGFVSSALETLLQKKKFDKLYACGPNQMLKALTKIADAAKLDYEFSLEAYMKCGFGICGTCVIGNKLVCKDGPVFSKKELKELGF